MGKVSMASSSCSSRGKKVRRKNGQDVEVEVVWAVETVDDGRYYFYDGGVCLGGVAYLERCSGLY